MIRKKKTPTEVVIDLTGPEGNAFCLLAKAKQFATMLDLDATKIVTEMRSGDYEHLVEVFDSYFGSFVILER